MAGSLSDIKVLDLSRVFSGPWAAQMLADFGADVIKVERPGRGDDVRHQGYRVKDQNGVETRETSSFIAMNRGKRSITIDMSKPEGQDLIRRLAMDADVLIENFKGGDLVRYGLDYAALKAINPRLIYCSITGFGQTGPYSHLPGYDPIFQSMSGLMSITGLPDDEPGAGPQKVGYSVSDLNASFYAIAAILAALHHRDRGGEGQHIDLALLDAGIGAISHMAMNYLVTGVQPERVGSGSQITCPYQAFECTDGHIMVAVGNDQQFVAFAECIGRPELATDERFKTNPGRAKLRKVLVPMIAEAMRGESLNHWLEVLGKRNVPCGAINNFEQVFEDPQVRHREMLTSMPHPTAGKIPVIANPVKFSETPVEYRRPPPLLGEHTEEILAEKFGMSVAEIDALKQSGII